MSHFTSIGGCGLERKIIINGNTKICIIMRKLPCLLQRNCHLHDFLEVASLSWIKLGVDCLLQISSSTQSESMQK